MATSIRTWWGQRFIEALEQFTDIGRLARGRAYANNGHIESWKLEGHAVEARIRGNVNPYFGVFEVPYYKTRISLRPIPARDWQILIQHIGNQAGFVSKLLLHEMPDNIETPFRELDLHLLPYNARDMCCECSCPDYTNPCKHVAGLCYLLVQQLDHDPFLLFELRGISREQLFGQLRQTPLGEILVSALAEEPSLPEPAQSYYTHPELQGLPSEADPHAFWQGAKKPPTELPVAPIHSIPAVIIKKGGDYPRFWPHSASFIQIMEQVYGAIRKKAKQW